MTVIDGISRASSMSEVSLPGGMRSRIRGVHEKQQWSHAAVH